MSSDSEGEDYSSLQQQLSDLLDSCVEKQIGGDVHKKKKNKKKEIHPESNQSHSPQKNKYSTNNQPESRDFHSKKGSDPNINKIKAFTSAIKRQKLQSTAAKIKHKENSIKTKVKEIFEPKPNPKVESEDDMDSSIEDDVSNNDSDIDEQLPEDDNFSDNSDWDDLDDNADQTNSPKVVGSKQKQLDKFKSALGITDEELARVREEKQRLSSEQNREPGRVTTIGLLKGNVKNRPPPEVIVFGREKKEKKGPKKKVAPEESEKKAEVDEGMEFDLHRARHEVRRLGIHSLDGSRKEAGMVDLLVGLGAVPPKREKLNYKQLQEKRKHEKEEALNKRMEDRKLGFKVVNPNRRKRKLERDRNDVGISDGQVGSYRDGVQMVGKKLIKQVGRKKRQR